MWDDYYGPMHPGFILEDLASRTLKVPETDTPIPPELEREVEGLRALKRRVIALYNAHSEGRNIL